MNKYTKKQIYLLIFLIVFSIIVLTNLRISLAYSLHYQDDYTNYYGTTTDGKAWTSPTSTIEFKLALCGLDEPRLMILLRDSGQELGLYCNTYDEGTCINLPGIDAFTCNDPADQYGDLCDQLFENSAFDDANYDDLYIKYYIDDGYSCNAIDTSERTYNVVNNSFHRCWDNRSGMNIYSNGYQFGGGESEILLGYQNCSESYYCSTALENVSQTLANKDYTIRCSECGTNQKEYVNRCINNKQYYLYSRWIYESCGNTSWQINSSLQTCNNEYYCDMESFQIETNPASVDSLCYSDSDVVQTDWVDDWGINHQTESTYTDGILFNYTLINFSLDTLSNNFPEEVSCFTTQDYDSVRFVAIINGETVNVYRNSPDTMLDGTEISLQDFNLSKQSIDFTIDNGVVCDGLTMSRFDKSDTGNSGEVTPTVTFDCDGEDYEVTLYGVDFYYDNYEICFGSQENIDNCYNSASEFDILYPQNDFERFLDDYPERVDNSQEAWETYYYNFSNKQQKEYNLTLKYLTWCYDYDEIANESNNYSRTTTLWSTDTPEIYLIQKRKSFCINESVVGISGIYSDGNITFSSTYTCNAGYECNENNSFENYNRSGYMNLSYTCTWIPTCSDGIKNSNELFVDYGGQCGTCFDGVLNNNETANKVYKSDYGGYCGNCTPINLGKIDPVWVVAKTLQKNNIPFDYSYCQSAQNGIYILVLFFVVVIIFVFIILFVFVGIDTTFLITIIIFIIRWLIKKRRSSRKKQKVYKYQRP